MSHSFKLQNKLSNIFKFMTFSALLLMICNLALAADQNAQEAWQRIDAGALVVDVRTAEEFAQGHLPNAINIPFEQITTVFTQKKMDKDQAVVLYCRSGRRSGIANDALISAGYRNTYNGGGYQMLIQQKK
ncbi:rhodanese-like domain-containing protein [Shewanella sp. KX20019]|uniref:rhodanese-like domain-containing protein n=1 Tax=Shewanella sp. KX20019 TaxID=2803864 RepID=UPI001926609E|nr:rhodanese-like domain-containing protein [Shewanella sp. KX20019]QQX78784.1 rhodanese-like domain-containing protein [Shewanella sp. KX20019]